MMWKRIIKLLKLILLVNKFIKRGDTDVEERKDHEGRGKAEE